ncbi:MAG: M1 family metallopeptidase, partial [Gemmatimonadaceae bacterium]
MRSAATNFLGLTTLALTAFASACATGGGVRPAPDVRATSFERPRPYPVYVTRAFESAVASGTRTRTGRPGPRYWQQHASYRLEAVLDPATARLEGRGTIRYLNNSPDTLSTVYLHLRNNLFGPTALRNELVPVVGGVDLHRVAVNGRVLTPIASGGRGPGYEIASTILGVTLERPLLPNDSIGMELEWALAVPPDGAPRGGTDGEVYFVSYWYPQMAVYDDVEGWQTDPYMSNAEFYMGFADYDVAITVPAGW